MKPFYDEDESVKQAIADQIAEEGLEAQLSEMLDQEALDHSQTNSRANFDINAAIKPKAGSASCLYLLLDSRKWKPGQSFAEFISAVFYVGQDYEELIRALDLSCSKEKIILEIWKSGKPVYVIKVMDSQTQAAVKFGEFAIIETMGILSLTNKIRGHINSVPDGFSDQDAILYGAALLSKVYAEKTNPIAAFKDSFNTKQHTPSWPPGWFRQIAEKSDINLLQTLPIEKLAYLSASLSERYSVKPLKNAVIEDILENEDIIRQLKDRFGQSFSTRLKNEDPVAYEAHLEKARERKNASRAKLKKDPVAYEVYLEKNREQKRASYAKKREDAVAYEAHLEKERKRVNAINAKRKEDAVAHEAHLEKAREQKRASRAKLKEDAVAHEAYLKQRREKV